MLIYYSTIVFLLISGFYLYDCNKNNMSKIIFLVISGILLTLISTLRYGIGFDYFSYKNIFKEISNVNIFEIRDVYSSEILYAYINKFISYLGGNYLVFLLFINIFVYSSIIWFIYKYSKNFYISIFIFITFQFFAHSMNLLRQTLSLAIFLFSYQFIVKRKFIPYILILFLGFLFHKSIIFLIPMYFILNLKFNIKSFIIISALSIILYIFTDDIFSFFIKNLLNIYSNYENTIYWKANSFKYIIFQSFYFIFVVIFSNKLTKINYKNNILINTAFYTFLTNIFITKHFIFERFSIYMFIFSIILLPEILDIYKNNYKERKMYYFLLSVIILIGLSYIVFASSEGFHNVYPYRSIFDKAISKGI